MRVSFHGGTSLSTQQTNGLLELDKNRTAQEEFVQAKHMALQKAIGRCASISLLNETQTYVVAIQTHVSRAW